MNAREIATFTGKDIRTVRRWIAKAGDKVSQAPHDKMSQGIPHQYAVEEVETILSCGSLSKNTVSVLMENARGREPVLLEATTSEVDYGAIGKMIGMAVTAALAPVVNELKELKQLPALPAPIVEDKYSLAGYCQLKQIKVNRSELALHGRELRKISNREGLIIDKIPDERWGFVNSYPVKILDEYFAA